MSKITIIGTSGAGKTVFITVLAERYSKIKPGRAYMEYANAETKEYSAGVWGDLVDKQKWPTSTPAGKLLDLQWILRTPDGDAHEMNVIDAPGQDIQAIYMPKKDALTGKPVNLTENQKTLKKSIEEADVLVLLVNLRNIADAKTIREKTEFEVPIVMAAKDAFGRKARVAVLFSQHDQLRDLFAEKGFSSKDPMTIVQEYIPGAVASIRSAGKNAYVGFVAAVANTETITEISNGELKSRSCPAKGFDSEGLEDVMAWLSRTLRGVEVEAHNNEIEGKIGTLRGQLEEERKTFLVKKKDFFNFLVGGIGMCFLAAICGTMLAFAVWGLTSENEIKPSRAPVWEEPPEFKEDREKAFQEAEVREIPPSFYSVGIKENSRFLGIGNSWEGQDDIFIVNKTNKTWIWVNATVGPSNSGPITLKKPERVPPGSSVRWSHEHNFNGGSVSWSKVCVTTMDDLNKKLEEQKKEYEKSVEASWEKYESEKAKWREENEKRKEENKKIEAKNLEFRSKLFMWIIPISVLVGMVLLIKKFMLVWNPLINAKRSVKKTTLDIFALQKSKRR